MDGVDLGAAIGVRSASRSASWTASTWGLGGAIGVAVRELDSVDLGAIDVEVRCRSRGDRRRVEVRELDVAWAASRSASWTASTWAGRLAEVRELDGVDLGGAIGVEMAP